MHFLVSGNQMRDSFRWAKVSINLKRPLFVQNACGIVCGADPAVSQPSLTRYRVSRLESKAERDGNSESTEDLTADYHDLAIAVQGLGFLESGSTDPLNHFSNT